MNLRDHLMEVRSQYGALTPANVVEAARPKSHPLHDRFEWNNKVAGDKYREHQARLLIRTVVREFERPTGEPGKVREFHAVRNDTEYTPVDEIVEDPISTEIILRQMRRDWQAFKARYSQFAEFADLIRDELAA